MRAGSIESHLPRPPVLHPDDPAPEQSTRPRLLVRRPLALAGGSYAEKPLTTASPRCTASSPRAAPSSSPATPVANHIARLLLDDIFGDRHFRAEIIWLLSLRWSRTRQGLPPAHQALYWYSRGDDYPFTPHYGDYSPATNVDQILQLRARDARNKAVYKRDATGQIAFDERQEGRPARRRLAPQPPISTRKPRARRLSHPEAEILLLDYASSPSSATPATASSTRSAAAAVALVAAEAAGRYAIGIDTSAEATRSSPATASPRRCARAPALLQKGRRSL
ncbi:MAG: hypothetical protein H6703_11420 [Myxococcales bacterium]|nr:hypothetical protein [Myxococcales bacterium]